MGKQTLVYVIGMSFIIGLALLNLNQKSLSSQDTYTVYYSKTASHGLAIAGANIGTHLCLADTGYNTNLLNRNFNGGQFDVYISKYTDSTLVKSIGRLDMRYYDEASAQWKTTMRDTVVVTLKRLYFSRFAYFSEDENFNYLTPGSNTVPYPGTGTNVWKITGDSLLGPVHTNGQWNLYNRPYFGGKITGNATPNLDGTMNPIYAGGYQWGLTVQRTVARLDEIEAAATSAGKLWTNANTSNQDLGLEFQSDGNVRVKIPWNTGATKDTTYANLAALAPNGVIGVKNIDVRVWGTYKGRATVFARTGTASLKGNVWIHGNLVAGDNPQANPNSTDMMGIVSERMTYISTTGISRNSSSQTYIDASIYCHNGVFAVEDYSNVPPIGRLNLYGGVTAKAATVFGQFSGSTLIHGMIRSFRYDNRFLTTAPPSFPFANKFQVSSWWEN